MMTQSTVSMEVRKVDNGAAVIDVKGSITAASESPLMDAYTIASKDGTRAIIINFGGLEYMNSSGIGLLVTLLVRAQRQRQKLMAFGLNEHYRHIFELTRLNEAITIFDSEADAVAAAADL
jgi:anti-sigma B factor antagonist